MVYEIDLVNKLIQSGMSFTEACRILREYYVGIGIERKGWVGE